MDAFFVLSVYHVLSINVNLLLRVSVVCVKFCIIFALCSTMHHILRGIKN